MHEVRSQTPDERLRFLELVRDYVYQPSWTPAMGAMLVNGIQPPPGCVEIEPPRAYNPVHVLSLDQVLAALKKAGVSKQFCQMMPDELEAVLVKQGLLVGHGDTKAISAIHQIKPQTVLKNLSQTGSLYGLRATKLPNRKLD